MSNYPSVADCVFLKPDAEINAPLPEHLILLDRKGRILQFVYKCKVFQLGISPDGLLCGFRGKLRPDKTAELVILKNGEKDEGDEYTVYDARFVPDECLGEQFTEYYFADNISGNQSSQPALAKRQPFLQPRLNNYL